MTNYIRGCSLFTAALLLILSTSAHAQVFPGEVGVVAYSFSEFGVVDPVAGTTRLFDVGSFGGGASQSILWDPNYSNSFIIGGEGFIGRAVVQGPSSARWEPISTATGVVASLSWDSTCNSVIYSNTTSDLMESLDISTGVITPLAGGPSIWGNTLNASEVDPLSGDVYAGADNQIWRIPLGGGAPVLFTTIGSLGTANVSSIALDSNSTDLIATFAFLSRVVRIDSAGVITDLALPLSIIFPGACSVAPNGDILAAALLGDLWRISGTTITLVARVPGANGGLQGMSRAFAGFRVNSVPVGGGGTLSIDDIPVGTVEGWTLLSGTLSSVIGGGSAFGLTPDMLTLDILGLYPVATPGNPFHWTYSTTPPASYPSTPFIIPPGTFPSGTSADIVAVAMTATGIIVSPITRGTW